VCHNDIMQTIDTYDDFAGVVASSILLGSPNNPPTSIAAFCNYGVNMFPFATMAAAFAYQQYVPLPTPHYVINNYCYYHPASSGVSPATCDTTFTMPPSQRFCSCSIADCVDTGAFPLPNYRRRLEGEGAETAAAEEQVSTAVVPVQEEARNRQSEERASAIEVEEEILVAGGVALVVKNLLTRATQLLGWESESAIMVAAAVAVLVLLVCAAMVAGSLLHRSPSKAALAGAAEEPTLTKIAIVDSPAKSKRSSYPTHNSRRPQAPSPVSAAAPQSDSPLV
jgi:hypothetical protein